MVPVPGFSAGSREDRIVLVQPGADEHGGRFIINKYHSVTSATADGSRHDRIQLLPMNPAFEPIEIEPVGARHVMVIAGVTRYNGNAEPEPESLDGPLARHTSTLVD